MSCFPLEEQKTHFAIWCIMTAPPMIGNDPRNMQPYEREIPLNHDCISADQDPTEQGTLITSDAAVFGAGVQARTQLEAICSVRPIRRVRVQSTSPASADRFAAEMSRRLGITVERADMAEIPAATVCRARVVVDHHASAVEEAGDLIAPLRDGLIGEEHFATVLGQIALGQRLEHSRKCCIELKARQPLTRPSAALSPSDGERAAVRGNGWNVRNMMNCLCSLPTRVLALCTCFGFLSVAAANPSPTTDGTSGQLTSPVETVVLRHEPDRDVVILGQRAKGGRLVLTPDTCFFYGKLRLTGAAEPKYPGAELNGNKSYTKIEGLENVGSRVVWPLWLPKPATLKLAVQMEVPPGATGQSFEMSIGDSKMSFTVIASDGSTPQPETIELPVTKSGLQELVVSRRKADKSGDAAVLKQIVVIGPGVADAVLVRSRWRAAAIHAGFRSSELEKTGAQSRLWVMEARPLPCEDSMYAPITTPFGYFGSTFNPDGTSGGINFSMWSYAAGKQEPPMEQLSHLLALGDPRQEFGGFGHEGTGVKPRGWNPFDGQKMKSVVLALRLEPGDPYDTYTGYFYDRPSQQWKLYASGRRWHTPKRAKESLLPGSFVEVPGPPDRERSAHIPRGVDFRGWCRDAQGAWHPIDQMTAGEIRANEPVQKVHGLSPDGWFRMVMGGLEQYRYPESKPVIQSNTKQPLPDYMAPARLAALNRMPASVVVKGVQNTAAGITLNLVINSPPPGGKVTVCYGPKDALTFADRWAHRLELGDKPPGGHTIQLPASAAAGAVRVLLRGSFGAVWSDYIEAQQ